MAPRPPVPPPEPCLLDGVATGYLVAVLLGLLAVLVVAGLAVGP